MASEWSVRVVEIAGFGKHPNADSLSITQVEGGYPCIFRTGEFQKGDLAVYIPVDSVVPDTEEYAFLKGHRRIEAKRLRGIFSMGLLRPVPDELRDQVKVGDVVAEQLGIIRHVSGMPGGPKLGGGDERSPEHFHFMRYTDHLPLRKHKNLLVPGEDVVVTEKIHGCNARFCHDGERLWVGSRQHAKRRDVDNVWWKVAIANDLEARLARVPFHIFYGEVFGQVQDLKYGRTGLDLNVFDVFDAKAGRYLNALDAMAATDALGLRWVPVLHNGPWNPDRIEEWGNGKSTVPGGESCIREGFVVRPLQERWEHAGRISLKYAGEDYHMRKNKVDVEDTEG